MSDLRQQIREQFDECEQPEHVERVLEQILGEAQKSVQLSEDEWIEVFDSLGTKVEFGEAEWVHEAEQEADA